MVNKMSKDKKRKNKCKKSAKNADETVENPSKSIWTAVKNIVKFLVDVAAVVTAIVAVITIHEMQADRDATYQPMILINPTNYNISWDKDGRAEWMLKHTVANPESNGVKVNEDGSVSANFEFALNVLYDGLEQFSAVNAGVGIAHNVVFTWSSNNIHELYSYLIKCDNSKKDYIYMDKSIVFQYDDRSVIMDLPTDMSLMYMLQNANETYTLPLPQAYYILLHEIIQTHSYDSELPCLWLEVKYYDTQGNVYTSPVMIQPQVTYFYEDSNGAGNATFQLKPIHPVSAIKEDV